MVVLLGAAGLSIDAARGYSFRLELQAEIDAVVVSVAKKISSGSSENVAQLAQQEFAARWKAKHGVDAVELNVAVDDSGAVTATAEAVMPTPFMRVLGNGSAKIGVKSAAAFGAGQAEVVLVLDNTGSMAGQKLADLQAAANLLIDTLIPDSTSPNVKISLVPFSRYVNVGLGVRSESWLDVANDYTVTTRECEIERPIVSKTNCRTVTTTTTCSSTNDGVTTTWPCTTSEEICDIIYGAGVEVCEDDTDTYEWKGCVGSRPYPLNVRDDSYTTRIPGLMDESCSAPITPLTTDKTLLKDRIAEMRADDETYIPAGLIWGWRMLSPHAPFTEGATQSGGTPRKILVLMTDGANTLSPDYPEHDDNDVTLANQLTSELCTNIKANSITVFTIGFAVSDTGIHSLLNSCATGPPFYYNAADGSQLAGAFKDIAGKLSNLRLVK